MVELADTSDLSSDEHCVRVGSSPTIGTNGNSASITINKTKQL